MPQVCNRCNCEYDVGADPANNYEWCPVCDCFLYGTPPSNAPPEPNPEVPIYPECPKCHQEMQWIAVYKRWFCPHCAGPQQTPNDFQKGYGPYDGMPD